MRSDPTNVLNLEPLQHCDLELLRRCSDFDFNAISIDDQHNLRQMLSEHSRVPSIVLLKEESSRGESSQSDMNFLPIPHSLLPTAEAKNQQLLDFAATRKRIALLRCDLSNQILDQATEPPLTSDVEEWMDFCQREPPLLRTILRISQHALERLLSYICEWLQNLDDQSGDLDTGYKSNDSYGAACSHISLAGNEHWLAQWLYASLACLLLPVEPNMLSMLREIARNCIELRGRLQPDQLEEAVPYNLFICLISKAFGQLDLARFV